MGAETAFPGAPKFEHFILLLLLVFKLEQFEPSIGISVFWLGNLYYVTNCPQNLLKVVPYVPHLSSKFQVSALSRCQVKTISVSGCRKTVNFAWKKQRDFLHKVSRSTLVEHMSD